MDTPINDNFNQIMPNGTGTTNPNPCPAVSTCHDWEYFPCGCSRCKKCGLVNYHYGYGQIYTPYYPYGQGTGTYPQVYNCATTSSLNQQCINNNGNQIN
jgi:hypothetical protein